MPRMDPLDYLAARAPHLMPKPKRIVPPLERQRQMQEVPQEGYVPVPGTMRQPPSPVVQEVPLRDYPKASPPRVPVSPFTIPLAMDPEGAATLGERIYDPAAGATRVATGVGRMITEPQITGKAEGASEAMAGAFETIKPAIAPAVAVNPAAVAGGFAAGEAAGYLGRKTAGALGAPPSVAEAVGTAVDIATPAPTALGIHRAMTRPKPPPPRAPSMGDFGIRAPIPGEGPVPLPKLDAPPPGPIRPPVRPPAPLPSPPPAPRILPGTPQVPPPIDPRVAGMRPGLTPELATRELPAVAIREPDLPLLPPARPLPPPPRPQGMGPPNVPVPREELPMAPRVMTPPPGPPAPRGSRVRFEEPPPPSTSGIPRPGQPLDTGPIIPPPPVRPRVPAPEQPPVPPRWSEPPVAAGPVRPPAPEPATVLVQSKGKLVEKAADKVRDAALKSWVKKFGEEKGFDDAFAQTVRQANSQGVPFRDAWKTLLEFEGTGAGGGLLPFPFGKGKSKGPPRKYTPQDPDIEARFQAAKTKPRDKPNLWSRAKDRLKETVHKYPYLGRAYPEVRHMLTQQEKAQSIGMLRAMQTMKRVQDGLSEGQWEDFTWRRVLADLAEDIDVKRARGASQAEIDGSLPLGFKAESQVRSELARAQSLVDADPAIKGALDLDRQLFKSAVDDLVFWTERAGWAGFDQRFTRENYYHHEIITRANELAAKRMGRTAPPHVRKEAGYAKTRKSEGDDYLTDYVTAQGDVLAKIITDTRTAKFLAHVREKYDISGQLKAQAQAQGKHPSQWRQQDIPEGYAMYYPVQGNRFNIVDSVPESRVANFIDKLLDKGAVSQDDIARVMQSREIREFAGTYDPIVIPEAIAKQLNAFSRESADPMTARGIQQSVERTLQKFQRLFKWNALHNPYSTAKYITRQITSDLEVLIHTNSGTFKQLPRATRELLQFRNGRSPSRYFEDFIETGGLESTLSSRDFGDIVTSSYFKDMMAAKAPESYAKAAAGLFTRFDPRKVADFLEIQRRYATFIDRMQNLEANNGRPTNFGASRPDEVMALPTNRDKAYKLMNDLHVAYDETSVLGQWLSTYVFPFYRFQEGNFKRTRQLLRNLASDDRIAKKMGTAVLGASKAAQLGVHSLVLAGRVSLLFMGMEAAIQSWNQTVHPEIYEELPAHAKSGFTFIVGRDPDTQKPLYFTRVGAIQDVLEWVGLDDGLITAAKPYMDKVLAGEQDLGTALAEAFKPANLAKGAKNTMRAIQSKLVGMAGPPVKLPMELGVKRSSFPEPLGKQGLYPDPSYWRPFDSRTEYVLDAFFNAGPEWKRILGPLLHDATGGAAGEKFGGPSWGQMRFGTSGKSDTISEGFKEGAWNVITLKSPLTAYTSDPLQNSYWEFRDLIHDYQVSIGKSPSGFRAAPPDDPNAEKHWAMKQYRASRRAGQTDDALNWAIQYMKLGGDTKTLEAALDILDPLYGLAKEDRSGFLATLSPEDHKKLANAYRFYYKIASNAGPSPQPPR